LKRLRFLVQVNPSTPEFDGLQADDDVVFVPLEDVWPDPRWSPEQRRRKSEVSSGYTRFREGDVLVPKITPTFEAGRSVVANGLATNVAAGTTELHVVRTRKADSRYLNYVFQSKPFLAGGAASMVGVAGQKRVPEGWLLDYRVSVDDLRSQSHIADFLDTETARIDALIERKQRLAALALERVDGRIELALRAAALSAGEIQLRHVADVTVGIVVTPARYYADEGVLALRGVNVLPSGLRLDDVVRISHEGHALHPKSQLRAGDLVTVRTGKAGATVVIPPDLDGANCIDLLITRPGALVSAGFLELLINSDWCRKHIAKHSVGSIQGHFNVEALKELPVPRLGRVAQDALVEKVEAGRAPTDRLVAALESQMRLLHEHRQALITAAVKGDLHVSKAAA
jgi:type I restriction enzyme, S subunit